MLTSGTTLTLTALKELSPVTQHQISLQLVNLLYKDKGLVEKVARIYFIDSRSTLRRHLEWDYDYYAQNYGPDWPRMWTTMLSSARDWKQQIKQSLKRRLIDEVRLEPKNSKGKFAKRLKAYIYNTYDGYKLDTKIAEKCATLLNELLPPVQQEEITVRVEELNWSLGAEYYYNGASCWWGGSAKSFAQLYHMGGLALLSDSIKGRVWAIPYRNGIVVFNVYGDWRPSQWAVALADHFETRYEQVGISADIMYVNGSSGHYIGPDTFSESRHYVHEADYGQFESGDIVDCGMDSSDAGLRQCDCCGDWIISDDSHTVMDANREYLSYCESCWDDESIWCDPISEYVVADDAVECVYVHQGYYDRHPQYHTAYTLPSADNNYHECEVCGQGYTFDSRSYNTILGGGWDVFTCCRAGHNEDTCDSWNVDDEDDESEED